MLLGWVIRILIVVLVLRAIWSFVSGLFEPLPKPPRSGPTKNVALVRDPVCGTYLPVSRALSTRTSTTVHYFCSEACRHAFEHGAGQTTHEVSS